MSREYQRKTNNPYLLPHNLYMRVIYIIRDYNRLKSEAEQILHASPAPPDGQPVSRGFSGSVTERKAIKLSEIDAEIHAIENALNELPEFFRKPVMNNILYGLWYPPGASDRTYRRYKQQLVYYVAKNMYFI